MECANLQNYVVIPGEDSVISQKDFCFQLNFHLRHEADEKVCAVGSERRLVFEGSKSFINEHGVTNSSGRSLESIDHRLIASLMY